MPAQNKPSQEELFIGLLSGTSRDGTDLALVSFEDDKPALVSSACFPYSTELADALRAAIESGQRPDKQTLNMLDRQLGEFFASCVHKLLHDADVYYQKVKAIGSHGQTVWHEPPESIQLGDPALIASKTGIMTIGRFRQPDLEAGGEGAPLAPLIHRAMLRPEHGQRGILNLGGIANLTLLDARGNVSGYDTGPANCLLDGWIRRNKGEAFDRNGQWAGTGKPIIPVLMTLLEDPWFSRPPPKSTGVEYFHLKWLEQKVQLEGFAPEDIQATLSELTARSVANEIPDQVSEVLICGGGIHNDDLLRRLKAARPDCTFESTLTAGIDPDAVEAMLFAWLARERLLEHAQDTTSITGARHPVLLGSLYQPEQSDRSSGLVG
ncbi:MAG TPA: anhydro-N-acetylmuramic acid kinase [Xanthomonadales bacterium]|nr:anhydro-N-acetylmuramic acid kinase [Xanthomonadales bacterium]